MSGNDNNDTSEALAIELISERLGDLEEKYELDRKSIVKRLGSWGGIIALIVSVFVGGLEIYDKTVGQRSRNEIADYENISRNLEKMARYNQELAILLANDNKIDFNVKGAFYHAERLKLLGEIDAISPSVKSKLDSVKLLSLADAYGVISDFPKAKKYAADAISKADKLTTKVEGRRLLAVALNVPSTIQDKAKSRSTMMEAFELVNSSFEPQATPIKMGLFDSWVKLEASAGDCVYANRLLDEFVQYLETSPLQNATFDKDEFRANYSAKLPCDF